MTDTNELDVTAMRAVLVARQRQLLNRISKITSDLRREAGLSADSGERVVELENDEVLEGLDDAGRTELAAVNAAIDRVDAGQYGRCVVCKKKIKVQRLQTIPHTPFCVKHVP